MLILSALLSVFIMANEADHSKSYYNIEEAKMRCQTSYTQSPTLYMSEYSWGYSLKTMSGKFEEIYASGKRLDYHNEYNKDEDQFYLFLNKFSEVKPLAITEEFIKSVTYQIESAHNEGFAEFVFFPDMGHSHLYFPLDHWEKEYESKDFEQEERYQKMLADPKMRPLYHLTEQLQMQDEHKEVIDDPVLAFKYWHRNFMGYNNSTYAYDIPVNKVEDYNTVREVPGYHRWSAGFAVSASKEGCFPYRDAEGNKRYFDISMHDPGYDSGEDSGYGL